MVEDPGPSPAPGLTPSGGWYLPRRAGFCVLCGEGQGCVCFRGGEVKAGRVWGREIMVCMDWASRSES